MDVGIESNMCDNNGIIYTGAEPEIVIDLGDLDLGDIVRGVISLSPDDVHHLHLGSGDSVTGPPIRSTGKVKLLVSESDCDCIAKRDYT